jgi:hypothetical protein
VECVKTGKGFVALDSIRSCVQLSVSATECYILVMHGKKENLSFCSKVSLC